MNIKEQELIHAYLSQATRSQWHLFAARSNYDSNFVNLQWLIDNNETDRATILLIYWNLGAAWYVQYDSEEEAPDPEVFRLLRRIEKLYHSDFYQYSEIWFDPSLSEGARPDEYPNIPVKNPIPEMMLMPVNGCEYVEISDDPDGFDEGLPFDVVKAIYALYDET